MRSRGSHVLAAVRCSGESLEHLQMDVEAAHRQQVLELLGPAFLCFEEVDVEHPLFEGLMLRADVIAIPVEEELWGHALAFEVKTYGQDADYAKWSGAVKQASDYVLGSLRSKNQVVEGRRVSAAFVYPAPKYQPYVPRENPPADISQQVMIAGVFHCAIHWRVGRAFHSERDGFSLSFGPNELWTTRRGFSGQAKALLKNKRRVGSRSVDICARLDGFDAKMPDFE